MNNVIKTLEFCQVGWVVPDIHAAAKFLSKSLGIEFPEPHRYSAEELQIKYKGKIVPHEGLTTQTYNGIFIELIQPLSGESVYGDYLEKFPQGGIQHNAYRLPEDGFDRVVKELSKEYEIILEVDHPIARMKYFDTYKVTGVATEIMGITPEGWKALGPMEKGKR